MAIVDFTKSLEQLDGEHWKEQKDATTLMRRALALRKTPLQDLELGDFRFLLTQKMGVPFLLPRVISILELSPLAESEYYPGDLLSQVLQLQDQLAARQYRERLLQLANKAFQLLSEEALLGFEAQFQGLSPAEFGLTAEAYERGKRAAMAEVANSSAGKFLMDFIESQA